MEPGAPPLAEGAPLLLASPRHRVDVNTFSFSNLSIVCGALQRFNDCWIVIDETKDGQTSEIALVVVCDQKVVYKRLA